MPEAIAPQSISVSVEPTGESQEAVPVHLRTSTRSTSPNTPRKLEKSFTYVEMLQALNANAANAHQRRGSLSTTDNSDLNPEQIRKDALRLAARLKRSGRCLLNPTSKFMQYWDFATLSALFFTSTITPYEVCMLQLDRPGPGAHLPHHPRLPHYPRIPAGVHDVDGHEDRRPLLHQLGR